MTELEIDLKTKIVHMMIEKIDIIQNLKECTNFYNGWIKQNKL